MFAVSPRSAVLPGSGCLSFVLLDMAGSLPGPLVDRSPGGTGGIFELMVLPHSLSKWPRAARDLCRCWGTEPSCLSATSFRVVPPARARTCVFPLTKRVLYPLSYGGDRVDSRRHRAGRALG